MHKICYIIPSIDSNGHEHFAAIPKLLEEIGKQVSINVIAERSNEIPQLRGISSVQVINERRLIPRVIRTIQSLEKCRAGGVDIYFIRVSRVAALITGLWCLVRGGRVYYWHSGAIVYRPFKSVAHFKDWIWSGVPVKLAFKLCYRLVTGPRSMIGHYVKEFGVPERKIVVLPNDVDVQKFTMTTLPDKARLRTDLELPQGNVMVMAHRLSPVRRLAFYMPPILRILELFPDWSLVIVGDGPEYSELSRLVANANMSKRVLFVGSVAHSKVATYLRAADVFINPSYVEGFPRVVVEAMACGLPMVVTDAGGTFDLLPECAHSWIAPRDEADSFGAALGKMLALADEDRNRLGDALCCHAQRYSTVNVAREYVSVLFGDAARKSA